MMKNDEMFPERISDSFKISGRSFSIFEHKLWIDNIYSIYGRMNEKYKWKISEVNDILPIYIFPGVYAPNFFTDSYWFSKNLPKIIDNNKSFLEIGTGTGIISIVLAKSGKFNIVATDIAEQAVKNAYANVKRHNLTNFVKIRASDVYDSLMEDEKFDYIFWAHPFNNSPIPISDPLLCTGLDYNYKYLRKYISGAREHLTPTGKLLLGTGDSADLDEINNIATENNYRMNLLLNEIMPLEFGTSVLIEYRIYQFIDIY